MVTVEARALAKKRALIPAWSIPFDTLSSDGDSSLTLREFLERVVRHEVAGFHERENERGLHRVLSQRAIEDGSERGKITPGQAQRAPQHVDVESAIATALQAFVDGIYLVLIDGEEKKDLEAQVYIRDTTHVVFLRLTFLAGG
ncbi:MAG: hypothetical protein H6832_13505 [Planctomycetes bacterium]|nr:hypothetical protein [Planctomycetota bacterium]MCB9919413.1 hypothetical protein [Planctomycetota bacterium]